MTVLFGYPEDPCEDCFDGECTMNCSPKIMRLSKSGSYPYMAAAHVYGVDYGDVLRMAEGHDGHFTNPYDQIVDEAVRRARAEERRRRERAK